MPLVAIVADLHGRINALNHCDIHSIREHFCRFLSRVESFRLQRFARPPERHIPRTYGGVSHHCVNVVLIIAALTTAPCVRPVCATLRRKAFSS